MDVASIKEVKIKSLLAKPSINLQICSIEVFFISLCFKDGKSESDEAAKKRICQNTRRICLVYRNTERLGNGCLLICCPFRCKGRCRKTFGERGHLLDGSWRSRRSDGLLLASLPRWAKREPERVGVPYKWEKTGSTTSNQVSRDDFTTTRVAMTWSSLLGLECPLSLFSPCEGWHLVFAEVG